MLNLILFIALAVAAVILLMVGVPAVRDMVISKGGAIGALLAAAAAAVAGWLHLGGPGAQ
jgi:hypothetical protein